MSTAPDGTAALINFSASFAALIQVYGNQMLDKLAIPKDI